MTTEKTTTKKKSNLEILAGLAHEAMIERGLQPDFSPQVQAELNRLNTPATGSPGMRDMRSLLWCSIDNVESRDLDQLSVAEAAGPGQVRVWVAIADVDALVKKGSAIDAHARENTTSVYTPAVIFPMLPEKLSTNLTSLNYDEDRQAMVIEMVFREGELVSSDVYQAVVHNHAKLAYPSVGAWLEGTGEMPPAMAAAPGLADNLRLQDQVAQMIKQRRHEHGALTLETIDARPVIAKDDSISLEVEQKNHATELIENFMIAANGVTARFLTSKNMPSIRRVVLAPKRWDRIVELADEHGVKLPDTPDSIALEAFLVKEKALEPLRFPDLSLAVIKLLGSGEYVAELPGEPTPDHFGLAARDYTHSTAPNRRYSDLITQRLLKAALAGQRSPYNFKELQDLAKQCTVQEDEATKVERQLDKSAAALLLAAHIGEQYDALVTGASPKGTWVRLIQLPVEGKLVEGFQGVDVGQRLRVQLVSVDVDMGFIDFRRVGAARR